MNRRQFLIWTAAGGVGLASYAARAAWGAGLSPDDVEVARVKLDRPMLPRSFHGLKIVLLSDLHFGSSGIRADLIERAFDLAMAERPDLFLFGGDLVTGWVGNHVLAELLAMARSVRAPLGVYGVLGNHEFMWGEKEAMREFDRAGIRILRNETVYLSRATGDRISAAGAPSVGVSDSDRIPLVGLDNMFNQPMNAVREQMEDLVSKQNCIVLEHTPDLAPFVGPNFDGMLLCGHTHGGQIIFPVIGQPVSVSRFGLKYVSGLYPVGRGLMYVTRGIGAVSVPVRIGCPPEVTVLELTAGAVAHT